LSWLGRVDCFGWLGWVDVGLRLVELVGLVGLFAWLVGLVDCFGWIGWVYRP